MKTGKRFYVYSAMLLALLLQSLVPQGFMPTREDARPFHIQICTTSGLADITVDSSKAPGHGGGPHRPSCPFAPVLAFSLTTPYVLQAPVVAYDGTTLSPPAFLLPPRAPRPYFSQGPPAA